MKDTGRIKEHLLPRVRRIVFGVSVDSMIRDEMPYITEIDRAHLVMLVERGLVDAARAARLLGEINRLRELDFAPLAGREAPRGVFLLYEDYLSERLGLDVAGILQTARSRNDLKATVLRLRLRAPYTTLLLAAVRLQAALLVRARRWSEVPMPLYTHYQPAVPVTAGHYTLGLALALERDVASLIASATDLDACPLGAAAGGGTSFRIDTRRTADLLGFERPVEQSLDAVASRDLVLRLAGAMAILGVTLSRFAHDLLLWSTEEFGFLAFPDHLIGSSSVMPQKKNLFLAEHIAGKSTSALGVFTAAVAAMHGTPFSNSVAVGTEGVEGIWRACTATTDALTLAQALIRGAIPNREAMRRRVDEGYTAATELANRLVRVRGAAFREAHHAVGEVITAAIANGREPLRDAARRHLAMPIDAVELDALDAQAVVRATEHGGGPGPTAQAACLEGAARRWSVHRKWLINRRGAWLAAAQSLTAAVRAIGGTEHA